MRDRPSLVRRRDYKDIEYSSLLVTSTRVAPQPLNNGGVDLDGQSPPLLGLVDHRISDGGTDAGFGAFPSVGASSTRSAEIEFAQVLRLGTILHFHCSVKAQPPTSTLGTDAAVGSLECVTVGPRDALHHTDALDRVADRTCTLDHLSPLALGHYRRPMLPLHFGNSTKTSPPKGAGHLELRTLVTLQQERGHCIVLLRNVSVKVYIYSLCDARTLPSPPTWARSQRRLARTSP